MIRRPDLSIGGWLGLGAGVAALLLVALGATGYAALERIGAEAQRSADEIVPRAAAAERLQAQILLVGISARTYALTRDDAHLLAHAAAAEALRDAVSAAEALPRTPEGEAIFESIPDRAQAYERAATALVERARRRVPRAALEAAEAEMTVTRDALLSPTQAYFALQQRRLGEASASILALRQRTQRALLGVSALALALFGVTAIFAARAVRRPALSLVAAARALAAGDFGPAAALRAGGAARRNELQELSAAFGQMAAQLQDRDARLRAKRERLQAQNEELQAQAEELQAQHEEIQAQNEQLLAQDGEIQAHAEELHARNRQLDAQGEQLRRSAEALQERDRRKTEFLAMLSHELRNPLAAVLNALHVLDRADPSSEPARRARVIAGRQLEHLTRLVDDLLDVTRITRGKIQLRLAPVDLAALVRDAADDQGQLLEASGVRLELAVPAEPVWVDADPARLAQVVGNLLQNAAKFTPRDGLVRVSLERLDGEPRAAIRVADNGVGIDRETLERLFQPFTQAERSLARTRGGLGLGLALVKGLVELHGGAVRAASEGEGRGAEIVVELPLGCAPAAAARAPAAPALPGRSVLVVDDNADAAESLAALLELAGHRVALAQCGHDGVERARQERPDAVLCDIGLPDIDGYEVARRLRADPGLEGVLLVALSGYALDDDLRRAEAAGFDAHVAKPATLERLLELIARSPAAARERA